MIRRLFDEKKEQFDRYVETEGLVRNCEGSMQNSIHEIQQRWSKVFEKESPSKAVMITPLVFDVEEETETTQFIEYVR